MPDVLPAHRTFDRAAALHLSTHPDFTPAYGWDSASRTWRTARGERVRPEAMRGVVSDLLYRDLDTDFPPLAFRAVYSDSAATAARWTTWADYLAAATADRHAEWAARVRAHDAAKDQPRLGGPPLPPAPWHEPAPAILAHNLFGTRQRERLLGSLTTRTLSAVVHACSELPTLAYVPASDPHPWLRSLTRDPAAASLTSALYAAYVADLDPALEPVIARRFHAAVEEHLGSVGVRKVKRRGLYHYLGVALPDAIPAARPLLRLVS